MSTDEWLQRVRRDFPYRPDWVYLQSAGTGLAFPGAAAAAGQYYLDVAGLGCDAQSLWQRPVSSARERMARLLSVPADEVGFFRNTSEVINIAAHSVAWQPGDTIVGMADEYPCNVLPWEAAQAQGVTVVRIQPDPELDREQQLLDALTPRTRVLSVSHVHPWTGTKVDLTRLGRACREVDALLIVDGIQALGATPVDLSYVDVYGAGMFKWMLSGFGTAVGVFRERARSMLTPIFRSYANPAPSTSFAYAAPNVPGLYVLDATLEYLEDLGWDRIHEQVEDLTGRTIGALRGLGIRPVTPEHARAGIVGFDVPDSTRVAAEMALRNVSVSDKEGRVLVSPYFYNTPAHIDRFAEALADTLRVIARETGWSPRD
ncbi:MULTISPECIES: aminotransferase class V-fold PLP-dependent enzyme [unclassified Microbacterium]|uniref:aminotransferase class V-fold PLP-dependent enzyme n=1 Tax=unclassified Microbacterium TaxID=2609290 RepID=UPI00214C0562|nr:MULTISPECIES: aminotransferase class V-fold PLP-dependent enzyme [unclassified Microbacterium]MCR2808665.1 aminotransferase class V-fold PLP-dependent enzyme [Microbacterium sp. zg.B185]WIM18903.1 aminotransferase class V-fold PLP-dependent enzyme [Microbacterium sp. zg-B185]